MADGSLGTKLGNMLSKLAQNTNQKRLTGKSQNVGQTQATGPLNPGNNPTSATSDPRHAEVTNNTYALKNENSNGFDLYVRGDNGQPILVNSLAVHHLV